MFYTDRYPFSTYGDDWSPQLSSNVDVTYNRDGLSRSWLSQSCQVVSFFFCKLSHASWTDISSKKVSPLGAAHEETQSEEREDTEVSVFPSDFHSAYLIFVKKTSATCKSLLKCPRSVTIWHDCGRTISVDNHEDWTGFLRVLIIQMYIALMSSFTSCVFFRFFSQCEVEFFQRSSFFYFENISDNSKLNKKLSKGLSYQKFRLLLSFCSSALHVLWTSATSFVTHDPLDFSFLFLGLTLHIRLHVRLVLRNWLCCTHSSHTSSLLPCVFSSSSASTQSLNLTYYLMSSFWTFQSFPSAVLSSTFLHSSTHLHRSRRPSSRWSSSIHVLSQFSTRSVIVPLGSL